MKRKLLTIVLSMAMVLAMIPFGSMAVNAVTASVNDINLGTTGVDAKDFVYFGNYNSNNVKWLVLDPTKDNTGAAKGMFLLTNYLIETMQYDKDGKANAGQSRANEWLHSDARAWCSSFTVAAFSPLERDAVRTVSKTDAEVNDNYLCQESRLSDDSVFFLSYTEGKDHRDQLGYMSPATITGDMGFWWLRSPYSLEEVIRIGRMKTAYYADQYPVNDIETYARPAFNLDSTEVLFTSATSAAKSTFDAVGNRNASANTWKVTLKDNDAGFAAVLPSTVKTGLNATVNVTAAGSGKVTYNKTSAMLVDNSGNIVAYGSIGDSTLGIKTFKIPSAVVAGTYTLKVFPEQVNGGNATDYAGKVIERSVTVSNPDNYAITYNENGGSGTMTAGEAKEDSAFTMPACTLTPPTNMVFKEWAIGSPDGTKVAAGATYTFTEATTVYPVWKSAYKYTITNDEVTITDYLGTDKDISIPGTIEGKAVTTIGDGAFEYKGLTNVTIPNSVKKICFGAFWDNKLTSLTIPNSVTTIEDNVFEGNLLTNLVIPNSVTTIGPDAFASNKLTSVTLPSNLKTISKCLFKKNNLTKVVIPKSVEYIGYEAFLDNPNLSKAVILNKGVDIDSYDVFKGASVDLTLYGYKGSTTETYANTKNIKFKALKELKDSMISDISIQCYSGTALTPQVIVKDGNYTLAPGTDYTVSYKDNDKAGTATVIITGANDYEYSTASKTFVIEKKQYSLSVKPYTNATVSPSTEVKVDFDGSKEYTITADEGYKLTSVLVNGEEKLSALNNNVLTIANPTQDTIIEVKTTPIEYTLTDGSKQSITETEAKDLVFKIDGPLSQLDKVYVNDIELNDTQYSATSGSTILTLSKDYLSTLKAGAYTLRVTYKNGTEVETTFEVVAKKDPGDITGPTGPEEPGDITEPIESPKSPTTGDTTDMGLWIAILAVAAVTTTTVVCRKKTQK